MDSKKFFWAGIALAITTEATLFFVAYQWFATSMAVIVPVVAVGIIFLTAPFVYGAVRWLAKKAGIESFGEAAFMFPTWAPLFAPYVYTHFFNHGLAAWLETVKGKASEFSQILQLGWLQKVYSLDWLVVERLHWDWNYPIIPDSPITIEVIFWALGLVSLLFELFKAAKLETAPIDTLLSVSMENAVIVVTAAMYPDIPPGPFILLVGVSIIDVIGAPMMVIMAARHRLGGGGFRVK